MAALDRRSFLRTMLGGAAAGVGALAGCEGSLHGGATWQPPDPLPDGGPVRSGPRRSVVITPADLTLDWPERAAAIGLDTVALHSVDPQQELVPFIESSAGHDFLSRCSRLGLDVEYEMHAMGDLLPRALFASRPELFRLDDQCRRNPDNNLCVHQPEALAVAAEHALALCRKLRPTTGRYYLWPDDGANWCQCPCCKPLSFTDQQLTLENALLTALRTLDPTATLAHLAYLQTLAAPAEVAPLPGVFLEFAPINRRYDIPLDTPADPVQQSHLTALEANLAVFGKEGAKALEYWLDVSRFSFWTRPARELPFDESLVAADLAAYRARGVEDFATFAVWLDADYVHRFGDEVITEYGADLAMGR